MPVRFLAAFLLFMASLLPLAAQTVDPAAVSAALRMPDLIAVMQQEGIAYGDDLEDQLFPGVNTARWDQIVSGIYDAGKMQGRFEAAFEAKLGTDAPTLKALIAFFASERGQRILTLEIEARRALLDDSAEEAAKIKVDEMRTAHDPRLEVLRRFSDANDLIEQNVAGAMNANVAFYRGMAAGGAFDGNEMTEEDILTDVWSQEPDIRAETEDWLYPFLTLAYGPLSDEDMQAYIDFSKTPAAKVLNSALFGAFDEVFGNISSELGRAAARILSGQDI